MAELSYEHSAGGVIIEEGRVLLIQMHNLEGRDVWTFPKGHIETGETAEAAALREVAEETGLDCAIISEVYKAEYSFSRRGRPVKKDVRWFLMKRLGGDGVPKTPEEIVGMKWEPLVSAAKTLGYQSDLELLKLLTPGPAGQH